MDNQHKLIKGYRDLSQDEIELINHIKQWGEGIGDLIERMGQMDSIDKRWLAIGKTDLQTGVSALVRSVAKPEGFC